MKRGIALFVILALVLSAAVVLAQRQKPMGSTTTPKMGCQMGPMIFDKIKKELNLTPDQITQLEAIHKDFKDSNQSAKDDIKAKMSQMKDLWMVDTPDVAAIKDLASQIDTLRAQMRDSAIDHMVSALAILTADQRTKVRDWIAKNPRLGMGMGCGICCGAGMGGDCPMMK